MKILFITGFFILLSCKQPKIKVITYKEAIEACRYKREKIKEKYPDNELISIRPDCLLGAKLPDLEMEDMEGHIITTSSMKGKKNIINFWFITCPPCIQEMPWLNQIKENLGAKHINYIAISRDSRKDAEEFLRESEFNFTIIPDGRRLFEAVFDHMWGYPFTIFTDEELTITHIARTTSSEEALREEIMPFLKD